MASELQDVAARALEHRELERELNDAKLARNDAIVTAERSGALLREIASAAKLHLSHVQRIVVEGYSLDHAEQPETD